MKQARELLVAFVGIEGAFDRTSVEAIGLVSVIEYRMDPTTSYGIVASQQDCYGRCGRKYGKRGGR